MRCAGLEDDDVFINELALITVKINDDGMIEVVHEAVWNKLRLVVSSLHIRQHAQQEVISPRCPGRVSRLNVYQVTVRRMLIGSRTFHHLLSADGTEDDIPRLRRAVVVEIIVAISDILRFGTLSQSRHEHTLLLGRHIDMLLADGTAEVTILGKEVAVAVDHHHIVGKPEHKTQHEIA